jgi:hypothetical protein
MTGTSKKQWRTHGGGGLGVQTLPIDFLRSFIETAKIANI